MSEPVRFRDDPSVRAGIRQLLAGAGRSQPMGKEVRARSAARIDRLVAVPAAAGMILWLKGIAIAAGVGVVGAGVVAVTGLVPVASAPAPESALTSVGRGAPPSRVDIPAPPPAAKADPVQHAPAPSTRASTPPSAPAPSAPPAPAAAPGATDDPLAREAALLEKARGELDRDPAAALAAIDAYAAEFPGGALGMESELLAVDALKRLGRVGEARARGEVLLGRARGSIYEERVRGLLERAQRR